MQWFDMHEDFTWLYPGQNGLNCDPGRFVIDPVRPVPCAVITHGHADHARAGHGHVIATQETLSIMDVRYGKNHADATTPMSIGETLKLGDVSLRFASAGHILGSAQAILEHAGTRAVVSGDYKRSRDPTCAPFEVVTCDAFITEATFGLPVFRHPPASAEVGRLLASVTASPERCHLVGVYALGKAQRVIALLREAGYDDTIYLHGALQKLCALYQRLGVDLGDLAPVAGLPKQALAGRIVMCPPNALADRWSQRMPDPVTAVASGWMRIRARARQRGAELPLIISDHADWDELTTTIRDVEAGDIWVTHGREDALVHYARSLGLEARALSLVGREEDGDTETEMEEAGS